jgi:hypothetical protein
MDTFTATATVPWELAAAAKARSARARPGEALAHLGQLDIQMPGEGVVLGDEGHDLLRTHASTPWVSNVGPL